MVNRFLVKVLAICLVFNVVNSEDLWVISAGISGVVYVVAVGVIYQAGFYTGYFYQFAKCQIYECCTDRWIKPNITELQCDLNTKVFGQHLVSDIVFKVVKGHLINQSPEKALALSFNGWTGCGKNYVSLIIAENLFKKGLESEYANLIIATHHFPHKEHLDEYKTLLKRWVIGNISACPRSLFIFDEMDKMPEGLVDVLKPFLDHYQEVEGVDCRKAMFIFLSNTGSKLINHEVLRNWRQGNDRTAITIKQMDKVINQGAFNEEGGFWHSTLIERHLIDYFIPFLPLERSHVKKCAEVHLKAKCRPINNNVLNKIADEMLYFPDDSKVFSTSGCKKVASKVDVIAG